MRQNLQAKNLYSQVLNNKDNAHARFDAGTASGFLQLEAMRRGFVTHSMSGFHADQARAAFSIPDTLDIIDMIALGRPADLAALPEELRKLEQPGARTPLESILLN